ncbi:hypothetical protein P43SY_009333 [Pythium insidiosum]|uniref:Cyclic nucleotide-binding domain-containing protein n=1 Tax=Pythium insidiosum TaxID=114742 RepID=A0AAD5LDB4_PYTIN|nr:hypothetical protein P43SY_009333 [Pythium insidiosum]
MRQSTAPATTTKHMTNAPLAHRRRSSSTSRDVLPRGSSASAMPTFAMLQQMDDVLSGAAAKADAAVAAAPLKARRGTKRRVAEGAVQAVITGIIIAIVLTPVMIGFATMIYGHPEFESVMPMLTKLIFVSSVAHQLVITVLSPLPFAIAQTQDAGLIFLSSMAVSIMTELGPTVPMAERIATVVVHLSICASLVGIGLMVLGRMRLASFVQYLPTPVIGGYLAFIGFFMVKGGLTLMTGANLSGGIGAWAQLLTVHNLALLAPGAICGVLLVAVTARFQHFAVFPCCLVLMPVLFFIALWTTGHSMEDARAYGYFSPDTTTISLVEVYKLFDFSSIHWEVMFPRQLPTLLSMFLVIAFASSLDIASICMGTSSAMDYNEQLRTVGACNLASGLVGGYTGSYIFSQTVFSYRFHPAQLEEEYPGFSRLVGLTLALCELAIAMTPFSLTTVVPKFLFGSVMIFIGVDLLKTWLFEVYTKLLMAEYATVLATFIFLNMFGVQLGLAAGIALAAACFLVEYSRTQAVRVVQKSSNVIRNADQHELLYSHVSESAPVSLSSSSLSSSRHAALLRAHPIVTFELHGHIFFGSATRIQKCVKRAVYVRPPRKPRKETYESEERLPLLGGGGSTSNGSTDSVGIKVSDVSKLVSLAGKPCPDRYRGRTRFVVFNFAQVTGMDATAARTCFLPLKVLFRRHKIAVVYCGMSAGVEFLLRANDVLPGSQTEEDSPNLCHITSDLDLALDWCEQQIILSAARKKSFESGRSLQALLPMATQELSVAQVCHAFISPERRFAVATRTAIGQVAELFTTERWQPHDRIFSIEDDADKWYILLRGQVTLYTRQESSNSVGSPLADHLTTPSSHRRHRAAAQHGQHWVDGSFDCELVGRVRAGCIFGDMDYVLRQSRSIDAVCTAPDTVTAVISRQRVDELISSRPEIACVLQEVVLRASYMTLAEKLHSIVV